MKRTVFQTPPASDTIGSSRYKVVRKGAAQMTASIMAQRSNSRYRPVHEYPHTRGDETEASLFVLDMGQMQVQEWVDLGNSCPQIIDV